MEYGPGTILTGFPSSQAFGGWGTVIFQLSGFYCIQLPYHSHNVWKAYGSLMRAVWKLLYVPPIYPKNSYEDLKTGPPILGNPYDLYHRVDETTTEAHRRHVPKSGVDETSTSTPKLTSVKGGVVSVAWYFWVSKGVAGGAGM